MAATGFVPANNGPKSGVVSTGNSSTATLAGDAVFTGTAEVVTGYGGIAILAYSDVASAENGLSLQSSADGTNWDSQLPVTLAAAKREIHTLAVISKYFRVVYTNGSAAQSEFRLEVMYTSGDGKLTSRSAQVITDDYDVQLVRPVTNEGTDLAAGLNSDRSLLHKFGAQIAISTSYTPVAIGGIYPTVQVAGALAMRVKAGNTNDTAAGTGAREVTIQGLDETGALVSEAVATAGTSASSATSTTFIRVFRAWVSASGTYATSAAGSHSADIVIEDSGGAGNWATISAADFPRGQTQIGVYSVPLGWTAYIHDFHLTTSGNKPVDFLMFQRRNILETAAPYSGMRLIQEMRGIQNEYTFEPVNPVGPYPALTDIGFMAKGASTPDVTVDFEVELVRA